MSPKVTPGLLSSCITWLPCLGQQSCRKEPRALAPDGSYQAVTHPWLDQFKEDMEHLCLIEGGECLLRRATPAYEAPDYCPSASPPGTLAPPPASYAEVPEKPFRCTLLRGDGTECQSEFATAQALKADQ
eukprot:3086760-Heterocapsa_arctica.AAC.1